MRIYTDQLWGRPVLGTLQINLFHPQTISWNISSFPEIREFLCLPKVHLCSLAPNRVQSRFSFSGVTFYFWPKCYCLFLMQKKKQKRGGMFLLIYFYKFCYDSNICSWFKKKKIFQTSSSRSVDGEQWVFSASHTTQLWSYPRVLVCPFSVVCM